MIDRSSVIAVLTMSFHFVIFNLNILGLNEYPLLHKEKKVIVKTKKITLLLKQYKIQLITKYINDSTGTNETLDLFPLIIKQELLFFNKGKIIGQSNYNPNKIIVHSAHNGNVIILENHITDIGIIKGNNEYFYCINGYGGCSTCSEYSSINNSTGKAVYLLYKDYLKIFLKKGKLLEVLQYYGIDKKKYLQRKYLKKILLF